MENKTLELYTENFYLKFDANELGDFTMEPITPDGMDFFDRHFFAGCQTMTLPRCFMTPTSNTMKLEGVL